MTKTTAKKYLTAIRNSKIRHLTCEALSKSFGKYPEMIAQDLSLFEPMIMMDMSNFDLRDLEPALEKFIEVQESIKPKEKKIVVTTNELKEYSSIGDFVYKKMTINGLVAKNTSLSEEDLHILRKLVDKELLHKKPKSKHKR